MGGKIMKHFKTEEWIDYLNQVTSPKQHEAMRKHLGTSCKQCTDTVALWQRVQNTAAREAGFRCGRSSRAVEREDRLRQAAVRQLFPAIAGGSALRHRGIETNALPR